MSKIIKLKRWKIQAFYKWIEILDQEIRNMEEVPTSFYMRGNFTVDLRGAENIRIIITGSKNLVKFLES